MTLKMWKISSIIKTELDVLQQLGPGSSLSVTRVAVILHTE